MLHQVLQKVGNFFKLLFHDTVKKFAKYSNAFSKFPTDLSKQGPFVLTKRVFEMLENEI
jgi:hypothetical protein